ncbi:hypothetical protein AB0442_27445 [Kitasatospora sp. NPDC085895]|uniref:hypothetical protein n=1 Tax=Kitasatospora sp. NPDC085895 TaxID=3155057 RepID=UPI00344E368A
MSAPTAISSAEVACRIRAPVGRTVGGAGSAVACDVGPALLLPLLAAGPNVGRTMPGIFNTDRTRAVASLHRLAELDVDTALFGHGDPLAHGAAAALRRATEATM